MMPNDANPVCVTPTPHLGGQAARLSLRIDFADLGIKIGPGKIRLLELIGQHGSISAACREMGMSYRRAWLLVDSLNQSFALPVVAGRSGGSGGGGAVLLPTGEAVVRCYRAIEAEAAGASAPHLQALRDLAPAPDGR